MNYEQETKTVLARVTSYGRKPKSEYQALHQARLLLEEEGRWCSGRLFQDGDAEEVYENGSVCGTWQACAAGAVGLVTGDMPIKITKESGYLFGDPMRYYWEDPDENIAFEQGTLAFKALQILALAIAIRDGSLDNPDGLWKYDDAIELLIDHPTEVVFGGNDTSDRDRVVEHFIAAEALAQDKKKLARIRRDLGLETFEFYVDISAVNDAEAARILGALLGQTETDEYVITWGLS